MLDFLLSYFLVYTYAILIAVVFLASFGIPLPATALVIAAGAFASQGYLDITWVFCSVFFASVLGDNTIFHLISRSGGKWVNTLRLGKVITSKPFKLVEGKVKKHFAITIFLSRWMFVSIGPWVNIVSGLAGVPKKKFILWDILGEFLYAVIFIGIGLIFGAQWDEIYELIRDIGGILLLSLILLMFMAGTFQYSRNRQK